MKHLLIVVNLLAVFVFTQSNALAAELLYFYSQSCSYCEQWDEEVGSIYDKTEESSLLKLRRVNIHDVIADDVAHIKGIIYTPTFVAIDGGREIGRIVGYGGDIFFWQHIEILLKDMKNSKASIILP